LKIDQIDIKILKILRKEARTSFISIAKECKTSTEVIRYRYSKLKKAGIITGAVMQVLPTKIGLNIIGKLELETKQNSANNVIEHLKKMPSILRTWQESMEHFISAYFALPNIQAFNQLTSELKNQSNIIGVNTRIDSSNPFFEYPENLVLEPYEIKKKQFPNNNEIPQWYDSKKDGEKNFRLPKLSKMDPTERKIAKMLAYNARIPFSDISKMHNISLTKVKRIYQKLRKSIFGISSITINPRKLGYNAAIEFSIEIESGFNSNEIFEKILKIPNIVMLSKILGRTSFIAIAPVKDFSEFFNLKTQFLQLKGIKKIESKITPLIPSFPNNMLAIFL
jgi:DNA-binding Lrp family transcriptional regulator